MLRLYGSDSLLTAYDDVVVSVKDGNQPPTVDAGPDQTIVFPTNTATLAGSATDDGLPVGAGLRYQWSLASGPAFPVFADPAAPVTTVTLTSPGTYVLRLMATDNAFTRVDTMSLTLQAPPPVGPPPTVTIASPAHGAAVTQPTNVIGTVASEALQRWTLEYRAAGGGSWTSLGSGTEPVTGATLGSLDPTLLLNGLYELRLSATDMVGPCHGHRVPWSCKENQKVGQFSVSFVDLEVPVSGLPIRVTRTYDSRDKGKGDFGYGWRLDLSDLRVRQSGTLGLNWVGTNFGIFTPYCLQAQSPSIVTVTFPGGRVYQFEPVLTPSCQTFLPIQEATISYRAVAPTLGTLQPADGGRVFVVGSQPGPRAALRRRRLHDLQPDPVPADHRGRPRLRGGPGERPRRASPTRTATRCSFPRRG